MNGFAISHTFPSLSQPTYYAAALTGLAEEKLTSTPQIDQNLPAPQSVGVKVKTVWLNSCNMKLV